MSSDKQNPLKIPSEDQLISEEKLPYVKPELHRIYLDKTGSKSTVVTSEMVFTFTLGSTKPIGPS